MTSHLAPIGDRERAAFYRAALLLGLVRGEAVVAWADDVLAERPDPPAPFVDLASTVPGDLTALRERLLELSGEGASEAVVAGVIDLVRRDLASGRRSFADTMTVLKQLRAFTRLDASLNEEVKSLGVAVGLAPPGSQARADAERRVREWLHACDGRADRFLAPAAS